MFNTFRQVILFLILSDIFPSSFDRSLPSDRPRGVETTAERSESYLYTQTANDQNIGVLFRTLTKVCPGDSPARSHPGPVSMATSIQAISTFIFGLCYPTDRLEFGSL